MEINRQNAPKFIIIVLATLSMLAGIAAALICSPSALSSNMIEVVGAGFGILVGAVLFGSGLISLTLIVKIHGR